MQLKKNLMEYTTNKKFFYMLQNPEQEKTLFILLIIISKMEPHILSDGWPSYASAISFLNINYNKRYTHEIVNHSEGFTNANNNNTNTVECLWSYLRTILERDTVSSEII